MKTIEMRNTLSLCAMLIICAAGCRSFTAVNPDGFAAYDEEAPYRAVSPQGIMYRVRQVDNEPEARLDFWKEALKNRMIEAGYSFVEDGDIEAGGRAGYLLELAAPVGQQDYTFLIALFDGGSELVLVESAGEVTAFVSHRDRVLDAIREIRF